MISLFRWLNDLRFLIGHVLFLNGIMNIRCCPSHNDASHKKVDYDCHFSTLLISKMYHGAINLSTIFSCFFSHSVRLSVQSQDSRRRYGISHRGLSTPPLSNLRSSSIPFLSWGFLLTLCPLARAAMSMSFLSSSLEISHWLERIPLRDIGQSPTALIKKSQFPKMTHKRLFDTESKRYNVCQNDTIKYCRKQGVFSSDTAHKAIPHGEDRHGRDGVPELFQVDRNQSMRMVS